MTESSTAAKAVYWFQSLRVRNAPLISGLDSVVFTGSSATESVVICNFKPPQYLWFMLSGGIGDIVQFIMHFFMHIWVQDASICWVVCFTVSILFRHTTHRYLVFGKYVGGYYNSLLRIYCGYSISIVLSTMFNIMVVRSASVGHYAAFAFTMAWTGVLNFFILKRVWRAKETTVAKGEMVPQTCSDGDVELCMPVHEVREEDGTEGKLTRSRPCAREKETLCQ